MDTFRGDTKWIHKWEGHLGQPYWPKGQSGVTLDPGVDLGYAAWDLVERAYGPIVPADLLADLRRAEGLRGDGARDFLETARSQGAPFTRISISREQADALFPIVAEPYWQRISARFPELLSPTIPAVVHTAFLSLAYNRGPNNKDFEQLRGPLAAGDFQQMGRLIAGMQQDHPLAGLRRRRREEGQLILDHS